MFRISCFVLALCSLPACSGADAGPDDPALPALPTQVKSDLQQTLDDVVAARVAPGVALGFELPGRAPWSASAGLADVDPETRLEPGARFRAGSMLKMAVATATLQLVEEGRLSLDGHLTDYLPQSICARIPGSEAITLRMLLNHTAGLPDWSDEAFDAALIERATHVWSFDELLELALSHPIEHAPGSAFSYSNTDYTLLGEILSRITGTSWRKLVSERVFARAGMRESALPSDGDVSCAGCARGYERIDDTLVDVTEIDPSMAGPAGGEAWITTPRDVDVFLKALMAGRLFDDQATLTAMTDFLDAPDPSLAQTGYGLGLMRFQIGDDVLYGHLGGTAGYQAFAFFDPGSGAVVTGNMNTRGDLGAFVLPVLDAVGRALAKPSP